MQIKHQKCIPNKQKNQKTHESVRAVLGCFWSPVEHREGPIKSVLFVRCVSVTDYLRNRSEDFSETRHEVGCQKCKKRSTAAFLRFWRVTGLTSIFSPFLAIFGSFWDFAENPFRGFFLNPPKMCQQNSSKR